MPPPNPSAGFISEAFAASPVPVSPLRITDKTPVLFYLPSIIYYYPGARKHALGLNVLTQVCWTHREPSVVVGGEASEAWSNEGKTGEMGPEWAAMVGKASSCQGGKGCPRLRRAVITEFPA